MQESGQDGPMITVAIDARLAAGSHTGDSTYWSGLLVGLSRIAPDARFLLFSNAERPAEIPASDAFHWVRVPARSNRWWSLVAFPLAARRMGARAIHTQYNLSPLAGSRGITTIHDVSFFIGPQWFKPKDLFLLRRFVPASARRAARVITVSETSRGEIEKFIPAAKGKVTVTPLALSPLLEPIPRAEARGIVESETELRGPYLLTVGTQWPRKNMALAINAASLVPHPLAVTGKRSADFSPPSDPGLQSATMHSTGYVSNRVLSALYAAADLYLAPSFHEGFGLTLLEAFASECPVICSSGGAMPEVAGNAASVEQSWEPDVWARSIKALLSDSGKLDEMRRLGKERVAQFDWRETARRTLDVYQEVSR